MTSGQERNTVIQINVMFQLAMSVDQRIRLSAVADGYQKHGGGPCY